MTIVHSPEQLERVVTVMKGVKESAVQGKYPSLEIGHVEMTRNSDGLSVLMWPNPTHPQENSKDLLLSLIVSAVSSLAIDEVMFITDGYGMDATAPLGSSFKDWDEFRVKAMAPYGGSIHKAFKDGKAKEWGITEQMIGMLATRNETVASFCDATTTTIGYEIYGRSHPKKIEWKEVHQGADCAGLLMDSLTMAFSRQDLLTFVFGDETPDDNEPPISVVARSILKEHTSYLSEDEQRMHSDVAAITHLNQNGALIALSTPDEERTRFMSERIDSLTGVTGHMMRTRDES